MTVRHRTPTGSMAKGAVGVVLIGLFTLFLIGLPGKADAAYTTAERKSYFDSGKYEQDLRYVTQRARTWITKRTAKSAPLVRQCKRNRFRVGRPDPGPLPGADYRTPVPVPDRFKPIAPDLAAPNPGPTGATSNSAAAASSSSAGSKVKRNQVRRKARQRARFLRNLRKRCANAPKLAIAWDMDETMMSSFRYGSAQPNYDYPFSMYRNLVMGSQTALKSVRQLYNYALTRGVTMFVITARYDPLQSDPLVSTVIGGADLCDPAMAWAGACGVDFDSYDFRKVTADNLTEEGYRAVHGLYMRPPDSSGLTGTVKNSQRAEISQRRGFRIIAMFGDQPTDLEGGFYERGFKFQSPEGPDS